MLFLVKEQQLAKTCLSYTPHEAFTDCIGAFRMIGCMKHLNNTRCRHTSETGSRCTISITNQLRRCLPIVDVYVQFEEFTLHKARSGQRDRPCL